jgi:hypothetical protein
MPFSKGQSGNPAGRPVGSRKRRTLAFEEAFEQYGEPLIDRIVDRAMGGDPTAMRLCMERLLPIAHERPVSLSLPPIESEDDARVALKQITAEVAAGAITIREVVEALHMVEWLTFGSLSIDTVKRLARVERRLAKSLAWLDLDHDGFFRRAAERSRPNAGVVVGEPPLKSGEQTAQTDGGTEETGEPAAESKIPAAPTEEQRWQLASHCKDQ